MKNKLATWVAFFSLRAGVTTTLVLMSRIFPAIAEVIHAIGMIFMLIVLAAVIVGITAHFAGRPQLMHKILVALTIDSVPNIIGLILGAV
ncbi:MAG TPA: hypothetical protein V6D27_00920 [Vampirovibrionales bacterium]